MCKFNQLFLNTVQHDEITLKFRLQESKYIYILTLLLLIFLR